MQLPYMHVIHTRAKKTRAHELRAYKPSYAAAWFAGVANTYKKL